jgi:hypothetical protein
LLATLTASHDPPPHRATVACTTNATIERYAAGLTPFYFPSEHRLSQLLPTIIKKILGHAVSGVLDGVDLIFFIMGSKRNDVKPELIA